MTSLLIYFLYHIYAYNFTGVPTLWENYTYSLWYLWSPHKNNITSCGPLSNTKEVKVKFSLPLIKHHVLKT